MALRSNHERYWAYMVSRDLKRGKYELAGIMIDSFGSRRLEFLQLVADAIKYGEKAKWDPTTVRRRIIEAWGAACLAAQQSYRAERGINGMTLGVMDVAPTLAQVKQQFRKLFRKEKLPGEKAFERAFRELSLPWIKSEPGRPKGSKDSEKRTRRYNMVKRRFRRVANYSRN